MEHIDIGVDLNNAAAASGGHSDNSSLSIPLLIMGEMSEQREQETQETSNGLFSC